tara:strand:- start:4 stop:156 length:153 start_codon:yes stop_codon:yes gene_type:complete
MNVLVIGDSCNDVFVYGDIESAIDFAQKCTTHVVQKHGVAIVTLKEIQNG